VSRYNLESYGKVALNSNHANLLSPDNYLTKSLSLDQERVCNIYRVIDEVFPPLSEGIPEVIWNKKCEYTNGMQLIMKEIQ
jgi:hypothetical protein